MPEISDTPAHMPAFRYIVVSPFLSYTKGDVIDDDATIATVEARYLPHVVRTRAPDIGAR